MPINLGESSPMTIAWRIFSKFPHVCWCLVCETPLWLYINEADSLHECLENLEADPSNLFGFW